MAVFLHGARWDGNRASVLLVAFGGYWLVTTIPLNSTPRTVFHDTAIAAADTYNAAVAQYRMRHITEVHRRHIARGRLRYYRSLQVKQLETRTDLDAPLGEGYYYRNQRHIITESIAQYDTRIAALAD